MGGAWLEDDRRGGYIGRLVEERDLREQHGAIQAAAHEMGIMRRVTRERECNGDARTSNKDEKEADFASDLLNVV